MFSYESEKTKFSILMEFVQASQDNIDSLIVIYEGPNNSSINESVKIINEIISNNALIVICSNSEIIDLISIGDK